MTKKNTRLKTIGTSASAYKPSKQQQQQQQNVIRDG
jgi:hypothetical protein